MYVYNSLQGVFVCHLPPSPKPEESVGFYLHVVAHTGSLLLLLLAWNSDIFPLKGTIGVGLPSDASAKVIPNGGLVRSSKEIAPKMPGILVLCPDWLIENLIECQMVNLKSLGDVRQLMPQ